MYANSMPSKVHKQSRDMNLEVSAWALRETLHVIPPGKDICLCAAVA